jgi:aminocarboxymuconate-semialdehyde decarboxylase
VTVNIDVHTHLIPQAAYRASRTGDSWHGTRFERGPNGVPVLLTGDERFPMGSADYWEGPEARLRDMDAARVDVQVLSLTPPLYRYRIPADHGIAAAREANDEIAEIVRGWPHRFVGLATLPLQDPRAALAELDRAMGSLGLAGVAVGTHVNGRDWDDPALSGVLEAAERAGALIFIHPAAGRTRDWLKAYYFGNLIGHAGETAHTVGALIFGGVLDRLPGLKIALAHGGGYATFAIGRFDHGYRVRPEAREHIQRPPSDYLRRLYFDSLVHSDAVLRYLVDVVGKTQVVLGSDYPADMGRRDPVAVVEQSASLTDEEKRLILGGNLAPLVGLPAGEQTAAVAADHP